MIASILSIFHKTTRSPVAKPWLEAVMVAALLRLMAVTVRIVPETQLALLTVLDVSFKAPRTLTAAVSPTLTAAA
ncbi:hypothetical protein D3C71_1382860 [compost metagenome]